MRNLLFLIVMEAVYSNRNKFQSRQDFYQDWWKHCPHVNRVEKHWSDGCPDCTKSFCD